jgi:hypothetical protein
MRNIFFLSLKDNISENHILFSISQYPKEILENTLIENRIIFKIKMKLIPLK